MMLDSQGRVPMISFSDTLFRGRQRFPGMCLICDERTGEDAFCVDCLRKYEEGSHSGWHPELVARVALRLAAEGQ